jgi:hypothetical protein
LRIATSSLPVLDPLDPAILSIILYMFQRRIEGEPRNILSLFQYLIGALNGRRSIVAIKGGSGGGKNRLAKGVLAPFFKQGLVREFSRITATYLEHLGLRQIKNKDEEEGLNRDVYEVTLPEPILYLQEAKGAEAALQSLKLFYSEGKIQLGITIKNRPVDLIVRGIQCVITTTTSPAFEDFEFENRVSSLHIDETESQTKQIKRHQGKAAEGFEEEEDDETAWLNSIEVQRLVDFLNQLKPLHVGLPFGQELSDLLPNKPLWIRREHPKLQRIVRNIATIHQHQRTTGRDKKKLLSGIFADPVDLQYALDIGLASMKETLTGKTETEEKILGIVKGEPPIIDVKRGTLDETPIRAWTRKGILKSLGLGLRKEAWLGKIIKNMVDAGYLDEDDKEKPYRLTPTGLEPEIFDVKLKKDRQALAEWADSKGFEIVERRPPAEYISPFAGGISATPDGSDSSPLDQSERISSLHKEAQNEMALQSQHQNEMDGIGDADIPSGSNPQLESPFEDIGTCTHCGKENVPRRRDPIDHAWGVCQTCYEEMSGKKG